MGGRSVGGLGQDDDEDCVEHVWRLRGVMFEDDGSHTVYRCIRCPALLPVPPGGMHPAAV